MINLYIPIYIYAYDLVPVYALNYLQAPHFLP